MFKAKGEVKVRWNVILFCGKYYKLGLLVWNHFTRVRAITRLCFDGYIERYI